MAAVTDCFGHAGAGIRYWPIRGGTERAAQLARSAPTSYLCLLRHLERIIDFDAEIAHGAFQLRMS